jgi:hypothetical protein
VAGDSALARTVSSIRSYQGDMPGPLADRIPDSVVRELKLGRLLITLSYGKALVCPISAGTRDEDKPVYKHFTALTLTWKKKRRGQNQATLVVHWGG